MNIKSYKSEWDRSTVFNASISDVELMRAFDGQHIVVLLREEIVRRLADSLMEKIGPAFDKALMEVAIDVAREKRGKGPDGPE